MLCQFNDGFANQIYAIYQIKQIVEFFAGGKEYGAEVQGAGCTNQHSAPSNKHPATSN